MKKAVLLFLAGSLWVWFGLLPAFAQQTTTATLPASVSVPLTLKLDIIVKQVPSASQDPWSGLTVVDTTQGITTPDGMNFGTLHWDTTNNIWVSDYYYTVFLYPQTNQGSYTITQTCSGVVSGVHNLNKSFTMSPDYKAVDLWIANDPDTEQGNPPPGDHVVAGKCLAAGTHTIYIAPSGEKRIVRCYYGLSTGDSTEPGNSSVLDGNTVAGTYQGSVTFTITLN